MSGIKQCKGLSRIRLSKGLLNVLVKACLLSLIENQYCSHNDILSMNTGFIRIGNYIDKINKLLVNNKHFSELSNKVLGDFYNIFNKIFIKEFGFLNDILNIISFECHLIFCDL